MKKIFFIFLFSVKAILLYQQGTGFITINDRHLIDQQGKPFFVKGVNYSIDLFVPSTTGLSDIELRPAAGYYYNFVFPCTDSASCLTSIKNDFKFIRDSLGCNTIRLTMGRASIDSCGASDFTVVVKDPNGEHFTHTTDLTFLVPLYQKIADIAAQDSINLILLPTSGGLTCKDNPTIQNYVYAYLRTMADSLKNKSAIMAYDEFNEPQYFGLDDDNLTKQEICTMTHSWYDTLKINDPNHLITVGLNERGLGVDAFQWSSDVYKADFYAFHIYANPNLLTHYDVSCNCYLLDTNLNQCDVQNYMEKFNAAITWIQKTTNLPWMLGETGFRTKPSLICGNPTTFVSDGNETMQEDFMLNALNQTIKAGGMGTIWWDYKESYWFPPNEPSLRYYGLVDTSGRIKQAGIALKNFNSNNVIGTPTGYPSNYQNIMNYTGTVVTGTVNDQNGQPIKDAGVYGTHADTTGWSYGSWTSTDEGGNFTLTSIAPIYPNPNSTTEVNLLFISAIGYDKKNSYRTSAALLSGQTFVLNIAANYDTQPNPAQYMATNNDPIVSAPNILTLTNFGVNYSGSGTVYRHDFIAMNEIEILPQGSTESYVEPGAEAAFYIAPVDVDCNDAAWSNSNWQRKANTGNSKQPVGGGMQETTSIENNTKTVYLSPESFLLQVFPNPANDKVLVKSEKNINFITLSNMYGANVAEFNLQGEKEQQVNISALAPGTYMIKITYSDNSMSYTQIIKQ